MSTLYTHQSYNIRRTWLLFAVFLAFVIGLGYFISWYYDQPGILLGVAIFAIFQVALSYWLSAKIVLKISGAKQISRESHRDLWNVVENLSITAGLPVPKIYIIEDPAPNAFATGRDKDHSVIAVTSGLLEILDRAELEGVVAHELAHIGNRDVLIATVAVVLVGFVVLLSEVFLRISAKSNSRGSTVLFIVGIVLMIISPIIATLIQLAISRKREYLADASGALLTRYPEGLASALKKISHYEQPMERANHAMAHMYISSPFGSKRKGLNKLFMTHPPTGDRIKKLTENLSA